MLVSIFTDRESKAQRSLSKQGRTGWDENLNLDQPDTTDPFFMLHHATYYAFCPGTDYVSPSTNSVQHQMLNQHTFENADVEMS